LIPFRVQLIRKLLESSRINAVRPFKHFSCRTAVDPGTEWRATRRVRLRDHDRRVIASEARQSPSSAGLLRIVRKGTSFSAVNATSAGPDPPPKPSRPSGDPSTSSGRGRPWRPAGPDPPPKPSRPSGELENDHGGRPVPIPRPIHHGRQAGDGRGAASAIGLRAWSVRPSPEARQRPPPRVGDRPSRIVRPASPEARQRPRPRRRSAFAHGPSGLARGRQAVAPAAVRARGRPWRPAGRSPLPILFRPSGELEDGQKRRPVPIPRPIHHGRSGELEDGHDGRPVPIPRPIHHGRQAISRTTMAAGRSRSLRRFNKPSLRGTKQSPERSNPSPNPPWLSGACARDRAPNRSPGLFADPGFERGIADD
jgi:hypothetical protein